MELQEKMFSAVQEWLASGASKVDFLSGKDYSEAKFNYWLAKWKTSQQLQNGVSCFEELQWDSLKFGKVLEIEAPSGVKITVFA